MILGKSMEAHATTPATVSEPGRFSPEHLSRHLAEAIRLSEPRTAPSPHLFVENVFPEEFYTTLRSRLPSRKEIYQGWAIGKDQGQKHYQQRKQIYIHNRDILKRVDLGSTQIRDFWLDLQSWFLSKELQETMLAPFDTHLRARFGGNPLPLSGEIVTNGMINFHEPGYFIGPHPDTADRVVTAIFYLAEDGAPEDIGTHFYAPKSPTYSGGHHGRFEDFDRVSTTPYRRNSAVLFLRTSKSYHGVEPFTEAHAALSDRYVLQYMLIHKR